MLVPPDDAERARGGPRPLLEDPARGPRYGAAGLERARSSFSVAAMAERTIDVYREASGSPSRVARPRRPRSRRSDAASTRSRSVAPDRSPSPSASSVSAGDRHCRELRRRRRVGKRSGGSRSSSELVEERVRDEHRPAGGARLVDDLVRRARPHVVDERVSALRAEPAPRCAGSARRAHRPARSSSATSARAPPRRASPALDDVPWQRSRTSQPASRAGARRRGRSRRAPSPPSSGRARAPRRRPDGAAGRHVNSETSIP